MMTMGKWNLSMGAVPVAKISKTRSVGPLCDLSASHSQGFSAVIFGHWQAKRPGLSPINGKCA